MGKRGPRRKPAAIKMAEGTYRQDRDASIPVLEGAPEKPDWLSDEAAQIWDNVVPILSQTPGLLAKIDSFSLSRYCNDWVSYLRTGQIIKLEGYVVTSDAGNLYQHPAVGAQNKANDRLSRFEAKYGMTPSDRSGMNLDKPKQGVRRREA